MTAKRAKPSGERHTWEWKARFRRHAFGWKSQPAITRIKQAVAEIKKVAKKDPLLAAEGAVAFFERVSAAIEHVDGSSGSIGNQLLFIELLPVRWSKRSASLGTHGRCRRNRLPQPIY